MAVHQGVHDRAVGSCPWGLLELVWGLLSQVGLLTSTAVRVQSYN